jgi:cyclophilin family peptidyl-prolyl cis-trans isomerase
LIRIRAASASLAALVLVACGPNAQPGPAATPTRPPAPTPASAAATSVSNAFGTGSPVASPAAKPAPSPVTVVNSPPSPAAAKPASQGAPVSTKSFSAPPAMSIDGSKKYTATFETNQGTMKADLFVGDAPNTVNNFVFLARQGFYDGVSFHRVIRDFMIQTGDPTGTGTGGPGYRFADEKVTRRYERGTLAMANAGPNTNGSQFFIIHKDYPLPPNYTIFGKVTEGLDTLDKIATTQTGPGRGGPDTPVQPVTITSIKIDET